MAISSALSTADEADTVVVIADWLLPCSGVLGSADARVGEALARSLPGSRFN